MPDHTHPDKENSRSSFTSHHDEKRGGRGLPAVHPYGLVPVQPKTEKHWLVQMQEGKQRRSLPAVPAYQSKPVQKKELDEEELPVQQKGQDTGESLTQLYESSIERSKLPPWRPLVQKKELKNDLPVQGRFQPFRPFEQQAPVQKKPNDTGLPDNLKESVENLSGYSMDDVKVHYNSDKPAQLQALAYAQGTDIHIGPGQEQHLPHEAWHVVQQKQGRVQPTMQMKGGVAVNDDKGLENEADAMGGQLFQREKSSLSTNLPPKNSICEVVQRVVDFTLGTTTTVNKQYFVKSSDKHVLFSQKHAVEPSPTSLYKKENDITTEGMFLFKWTPNVRLFSDDEKSAIENEHDNTSARMQEWDNSVKNPDVTDTTVRMPTKGILGKNDCKGLGGVLSIMISQEGEDNRGLTEQNISVGDRMTHNFPPEADCNYHSATVVAEDATSLVTLEADVSKNLTRPEFCIRKGVEGFVKDNNRGESGMSKNYGSDVEITRAKGKDASNNEMDLVRNTHSEYEAYESEYHVWETPGVTDTQALINSKQNALDKILEITSKNWSPHTFLKTKPKGVTAIHKIVSTPSANQAEKTTALRNAKVQAAINQTRVTISRSSVTADFYNCIARVNIENTDSLQFMINDINMLVAEMDRQEM